MKRAGVVAIVVVVLAVAGGIAYLRREPADPRKPHQIRDEGIAALKVGDLARAQSLLELAIERADKAQIGPIDINGYAVPLFQAYALQDKVTEAVRIHPRVQGPYDKNYFPYPREANNFVTLLVSSGRFEESLDVAQKLAHTMRDLGSNFSETMNLAVWSNLDRLLFRAGDKDGARAAFEQAREQLQTLSRFRMSRYWPLEPGMRAWLSRYESYLTVTDRPEDAAVVAKLVATIEANSPSEAGEPACLNVRDPPPLGCLLEVPVAVIFPDNSAPKTR
jgi:tetratricopeptide (TPR) repeat protein